MSRIPQRRGNVNDNSQPDFIQETEAYKERLHARNFVMVPNDLLLILSPDEAWLFSFLLNWRTQLMSSKWEDIVRKNDGHFWCTVDKLKKKCPSMTWGVQNRLIQRLVKKGFIDTWQKHHKNKQGSLRWFKLHVNRVLNALDTYHCPDENKPYGDPD